MSISDAVQLDYLIMQGAGNRILVVDGRERDVAPPSADVLRRLADPKTGPGFDQLMWVSSPQGAGLDASYRIFNADASEVEQCGNGVRCVAWMLARESNGTGTLRLGSPAGTVDARIEADGQITVSMGVPEFEPANIPFIADRCTVGYLLAIDGNDYEVSVLSMGNPHCVMQVADVSTSNSIHRSSTIGRSAVSTHSPTFCRSVRVSPSRTSASTVTPRAIGKGSRNRTPSL